MDRRLILHQKLLDLLGTTDVYFQPPESIKMGYPCIIYTIAGAQPFFANGSCYKYTTQYTVMLIDKDPESGFHSKLLQFPLCRMNRKYVVSNLHHYVYTIYF